MRWTRLGLLSLIFAAGLQVAGADDGLVAGRAADAVPNKVPFMAEAFALGDVVLLEGPFLDAMRRDRQYLLSLDPDRLLHTFRLNAGLTSAAVPLGGWEAPDVELRGHSLGHYLSALAIMYSATADSRFKDRADAIVGELAKVQDALASHGAHAGYLSAFPEEFIDRVEARQRVWAPYYTLHKIMAGLLDVHRLCGNAQALAVLRRQADWVKFRMDRLTEEQQQKMLGTEFGGMADVLAGLYAVTGAPEYLRLARQFDHRALFDPLARGEDPLDGLHGNTQIPKIIAAAREYELTGEQRYYDIATFFWQRVALHRSYVIGGNTDGESFFPVEDFSKHLGPSTTETCNTYNMLKLTRHLFRLAPSAGTMDFYERGLFNHILASQDPATGMMCYYVPLKPGAFKTYSTPDASFWCCVGTGMENHGKYGDTIYFHDAGSLYVNLFIASELTWKDKGLVVRQETRFPESDSTRLTFTSPSPVHLAVKVRYPSWAQAGMTLSVNGRIVPVAGAPGSYVTVEREWTSGDTIDVRVPMGLHLEAMPDNPKVVALLYGPIVLAGDLGKEGLDDGRRYGPSAPQLGRIRTPAIPAFIGEVKDIVGHVRTAPGAPLTFQTVGLGQPRDVTLIPFYKASDDRYTVYWNVYSPTEWQAKKAEGAAVESRRKELETRTIDAVVVDDPRSEQGHAFAGEHTNEGYVEGRKWRDARNGWMSYVLAVVPDQPVTLVCTFRGSEGRRRVFDILVDGEKVATHALEYHPTELFDLEFPLPEALTRGKARVTVRIQSLPDAATGGLVDMRTVRLPRP